MKHLPEGAPATLSEAFALVNAKTHPTLLDLQIMALTEAASKELYRAMADAASLPAVQELLMANGREELAHAHRVSRAIGLLTGTDFPIPAAEDNPYLSLPVPPRPVSATMLAGLAQSEQAGHDLYQVWADNCSHPQAAELLRQNGREEIQHGQRLRQAAALMNA
jgi:rubrerythrin